MTKTDADALYKKLILDHYKHPRNFGIIDNPDIDISDSNPICGDEVRLTAQIDLEAIIHNIRFEARGCAISIAAASLLTELVKEKPIKTAQIIAEEVIAVFKEEESPEKLKPFGDVFVLREILAFPSRVKCVLMCWQRLNRELIDFSQASKQKKPQK